jgi:hypothetical protein
VIWVAVLDAFREHQLRSIPGHRPRGETLWSVLGGETMKKLIVLVIIAFLLFFVISNPDVASSVTRSTGSGLASGASAIVTFVESLFR